MRKLMWFTMGFVFACGAWAYGGNALWILAAAVAVVVGAVAAVGMMRKGSWLRRAIALLTGCLAGLAWFGAFRLLYLSPLEQLDGAVVSLQITASDYSQKREYGFQLDGVALVEGKICQLRLYGREEADFAPGDQVTGQFRLRRTTASHLDSSTYFQGKGIFLSASPRGELEITRAEEPPFWCFPALLRHRIQTALQSLFPAQTAPFAKALLLGDTSGLDYETDTALSLSGIRHVVAVSGLHISMLYGFVCLFTRRKPWPTALVGWPLLLVFAAVAGFTPSVMRSCLMVGLMMLAMILQRDYDPATGLSFAVLVMLLGNPLAVTSVSLQLSAGCVAGMLLFREPINGWLLERLSHGKKTIPFWQRRLCGSISMSASTMILVTPLSAGYFGVISLVGVLTNLLTLWAVGLIFNGIVVTCLLSLWLPGAAGLLARGLSWGIGYVLAVAEGLASVPLLAVYPQSRALVLWLLLAYGMLMVFLFRKERKPLVLLCTMVISLCLALTASWLEPRTADTQITMLDVGQGQSILLQSQGRTFLVDCGGDDGDQTADLVAGKLLSQGITRLDGIIITHYDRDHIGGLPLLLTRIPADCLFLPDTQNDFAVPDGAEKTVYVWEDLELSFGTARLQIFGPVYSGLDNENSLCVLFDTEKCDILITGDRSGFGEGMLLRRRTLPQVDILVAGHHGAATSTSEGLLCQTQPETVLISVSRDNFYGHPAPALLGRLERFGCKVLRTDEQGTITIRR